jgi:hypothetical protein
LLEVVELIELLLLSIVDLRGLIVWLWFLCRADHKPFLQPLVLDLARLAVLFQVPYDADEDIVFATFDGGLLRLNILGHGILQLQREVVFS